MGSIQQFLSAGCKLLFSLLLCLVVATLATWLTEPGEWYTSLSKPDWSPPGHIFTLFWIPFYVLMGLALWLVWLTHDGEDNFPAYVWFYMQLIFSFAWPIAFFMLKCPHCGFVVAFFLLLSLIFCIRSFSKRSKGAAYLMVPYFLFVLFITIWNGIILFTNPPPYVGQWWTF